MPTTDFVSVAGAFFARLLFPSLGSLANWHRAGPHYRTATFYVLGMWWAAAVLAFVWLTLGWFALREGPKWWAPYRTATFVLMFVWFALLLPGIWLLCAAQRADAANAQEANP